MKRLIVLCDGTWQTAEQEYPTNVAHFYNALPKRDRDGVLQLVYYDEGVGTDGLIDQLLGGAFGVGLSENIKQCYRFLVEKYLPGDEIYLFGFSRGAYTARSLAGLVGLVGIADVAKLEERDIPLWPFDDPIGEAIDEFFDYYRLDAPRPDLAQLKFGDYAIPDVRIRMVGVWDTVGSLGIPVLDPDSLLNRRFQFHDVRLGPQIERAYHAVSIDEQREPFKATLWDDASASAGQTLEQVWFAGGHGDVGGGRKIDGLSNLALGWMHKKAREAGLSFDDAYFDTPERRGYPMDPIDDRVRGIFKQAGIHHRDVPAKPTPTRKVDPSVDQKLEEDDTYRPDNYGPHQTT